MGAMATDCNDCADYQALPYESRFCDGIGLRQWLTSSILPDCEFASPPGDNSDLSNARKIIRRNSQMFNVARHPSDVLHPALLTRWFSPLQSGSLRSCSSALVASSLGTGILSLPFAFSLCGWGLGLATLTFAALGASVSLQVLVLASRYAESGSYAELFQLAVGSRFAAVAVDVTVLALCAGAIACYFMFEGDFVPAVLSPVLDWYGLAAPSRTQAILGVAALSWPLTLPAELSALRYVTVASPAVLLGTTVAVLSEAPSRFAAAKAAGWHLEFWDFDWSKWLQAVSIMLTAFTNQQMAVAAGKELERPSVARIVKATTNATAVSWSIYAIVGLGGYLSWYDSTKSNFVDNYPPSSPVVWGCRAMLAISLYFVIPVVCMPSARSLTQLMLSCAAMSPDDATPTIHAVSATIVLTGAASTAVYVSDVAVAIGLIGGVCATLLMFWYPSIIFVKVLFPVQPRCVRVVVLALLVSCAIIGTTTLYANVQKLMGITS